MKEEEKNGQRVESNMREKKETQKETQKKACKKRKEIYVSYSPKI